MTITLCRLCRWRSVPKERASPPSLRGQPVRATRLAAGPTANGRQTAQKGAQRTPHFLLHHHTEHGYPTPG
jgi:hypothetical protein